MKKVINRIILILFVILMLILLAIKFVRAEDLSAELPSQIAPGTNSRLYYGSTVQIQNAYTFLKEGIFNENTNRKENKHWFCIHNGTSVRGYFDGFVYSFIITGKTATRYTEVDGIWNKTQYTTDSVANAKFAYIVASSFYQYDENGNFVNNDDSPGYSNIDDRTKITYKQLAIWNTFTEWWKDVHENNSEMVADIYDTFNVDNTKVRDNLENNAKVNAENLEKNANNYAQNISAIMTQKISNKTLDSEIKIIELEDGRRRVGPFNFGQYYGTITKLDVQDNLENIHENVQITDKNGDLRGIQPNTDFYITLPSTVKGISKILGQIPYTNYIANLQLMRYKDNSRQNLMFVWPGVENRIFDFDFPIPIDFMGDLEIIKKVEGTEIKLNNVSFKIKEEKTGKWLRKESNGVITYTDEANATEFVTGMDGSGDGKIYIEGLIAGKYIAYETKNANYGYVIDTNNNTTVIEVKAGETEQKVIENTQVYVKLSGYIWIDEISKKLPERNGYYKDSQFDNNDKSFNGITVRLMNKNGDNINPPTTISEEKGLYSEIDGGEYIFEDVLIEELENYYIEFEYDGLLYQSVIADLNKNNGSKASDETSRAILDEKFANITNGGEMIAKVTEDINVQYQKDDEEEHSKKIVGTNGCEVYATTNEQDTNYNLKTKFVKGMTEEIRYVNLGLYKKAQADMALAQDLENVNLGINGYWHVYNYSTRNIEKDESSSWNVGVKFKNNSGTYKRAVYQSDIEYQNEDKNKELQVYLTYKIALKNESSYKTKVNTIVDYFDNRYEFVAAGTGLDEHNTITGAITGVNDTIEQYNEDFKKCNINVNTQINPNNPEEPNYKFIYVQFKLNREAVLEIINNGETLYNRAEINSYTVYKNNSEDTVAVVDRDSVPGNMKIGEQSTFEDDNDSAPPVQLELADPRKIEGTVFVDSTTGELKTGEIRQGNGIYDDGEIPLKDVEVTLNEKNGATGDVVVITDENGNYSFEGFVPGQYIIKYTWGDKTYTVQQYKSTIYNNADRQNNMNWYKQDVDTRNSDAIDDYELRKTIDAETSTIIDKTAEDKIQKAYDGDTTLGITHTKMNAYTPTMEFTVEYDSIESDGTGNEIKFITKNVDFGIVERARQELKLDKKVRTFKISLPNGQVLIDATVTDDGKVEGVKDHVTYMGPINGTEITAFKGYIKAEIDNELIQGSTLEVGYEIIATNISELDYMSEAYYKYGTKQGNVITINPTKVVDYLDKEFIFDESINSGWGKITLEELTTMNPEKLNEENHGLESRVILATSSLSKVLEPKQTSNVNIKVSKRLDTSEDLSYDNEAEVVQATKQEVSEHRGNIIKFAKGFDETTVAKAEEVIITPSTGEDRNYQLPIIIGITTFTILGAGAFFIKRKVLKNK